LLAVDLDSEHAVEEEVEVVPRRALLDQRLSLVELPPRELRIAGEERRRQLAFERALRRRDERLRLRIAPRPVVAVRLARPGLEVDDAALLRERALGVIDPVPRERARPHYLVLDAAVRVERERERRPCRRRLDAEQRPALDESRLRKARSSA